MAIIKNKQTNDVTSVDSDAEKLEPLFSAGGNAESYSHFGKQMFKIGKSLDSGSR